MELESFVTAARLSPIFTAFPSRRAEWFRADKERNASKEILAPRIRKVFLRKKKSLDAARRKMPSYHQTSKLVGQPDGFAAGASTLAPFRVNDCKCHNAPD